MTLLEHVQRLRIILDDTGGDALIDWEDDDRFLRWTNVELVGCLQQACEAYADRQPILDRRTPAVCALTALAADEGFLALPESIILVREVRIAGRRIPKTEASILDEEDPRWMERPPGEVRAYLMEAEDQELRLWPPPAVDTAVKLVVGRYPLEPLDWAHREQEPEVPARDQRHLVHYATMLACLGRGEGQFDAQKAAAHKLLFEEAVGKAMSAKERAVRREQADNDLGIPVGPGYR